LNAGGGDDSIVIDGKDTSVRAGTGNDTVYFHGPGKKNRVWMGHGDDHFRTEGSRGVTVEGGPDDDKFEILTHGELGEGEGEHDDLFPMRARFRGESGRDALAWDCKSRTDVAQRTLNCTHKKAAVKFSGMQSYKASRNRSWKDEFDGSSRPEAFYGGGKNDVMHGRGGDDLLVGGKGHDIAYGGPGNDTCKAEDKHNC
jgi:Ca2+-binding RTX toxin-like protein